MVTLIKYCLFSLSILLLSCNDSHVEMKKELVSLYGKEIVFPKDMVFTSFSTDTIKYDIGKKCKIVTYVGGESQCTMCSLKLAEWTLFIDELDSVANKSVPVVYIVGGTDVSSVIMIQKQYAFDFPMCIDESDTINKLNNFPQNSMMRTFLLDGENKIVLVGNPVTSYKIKEMYFSKIKDMLR